MPVYGFSDKSTAEKLKRLANQQPDRQPPTLPDNRHPRYQQPVVFTNTEAMDIPQWGCITTTGAMLAEITETLKMPVHQAERPNADSIPSMVFLNGGVHVETMKNGSAQQGDLQVALYDGAAPSDVGTPVGPIADQFYLGVTPLFVSHRYVADLEDGKMLVRVVNTMDLFRVDMIKTSGDNGSATRMNDWTYSIYYPDGALIEAGVQVPYSGSLTRRHDYQTQELGEVDPARSGTAYFKEIDNDQAIIIHHCDEQYRVGACEDDPVP